MTWFKSFSDGKGGYNTFDWSLGDSATYGIINLLVMIALGLVFLAVLPIFLVIIHPFCGEKNMRINSIVSIVLSTLFLIDYSVGGIFWNAFHDSEFMIGIHKSIATFHASLILINIILFILAKEVAKELAFDKPFSRVVLFIILMFIIARVTFYPNLYNTVDKMYSKTKYGTETPKN
jgi:cytochrome bd-type quinol oxidase subunit 2